MAAGNAICVGQIGAPHGVRGEVRVKSFTDDPLALESYGPLSSEDGREQFRIAALRRSKSVVIVRFVGVDSREAAERLNGTRLYVPRDALPATDEDEFYHADLIGLDAVDQAQNPVGKVIGVHDFGAGALLEIKPADGASVMIPFTRAQVPEIDAAAGRLVVTDDENIDSDPQ